MKKISHPAVVIFFLCIPYVSIQAQQPADTTNEGITRTLDTYLTGANRLFRFNGTALVAKRGVILLNKGYGWKDAQSKTMNDSNSQYHLGSITKSFTGAAILKLQEQGKLSLSDKLDKYLPQYTIGAEVTIDNLLRHQSGIYDIKSDSAFYRAQYAEGTHPVSKEWVFSLFKDRPLAFKPGTKTDYSNTGYLVLGWIIEKVSGKSYEQFIREQFLQPLNMLQSGFDFIGLKSPGKTTGYDLLNDKVQRTIPPLDSTAAYSAGGMYSTTGDLYRWSQAIQANALLTEKSWKSSYILPSKEVQFGLGWLSAIDDGKQYIVQNGNIKGFGTFYLQGVDNDIVIILLCNQNSETELTDLEPTLMNVWKITMGKSYAYHANSPEVTLSDVILKSYTGVYTGTSKDVNGKELFVTFNNNRLQVAMPKGQLSQSPLYAENETRFFLRNIEIVFEFVKDAGGNVIKVNVLQNGQTYEFKKVK